MEKGRTPERAQSEEEFETFKLGVIFHKVRKEQGLTQEQLAEKYGTTTTYISRIENKKGSEEIPTFFII